MFSFLSALTGVGIPLIRKFSSAFHSLDEDHTFNVLSEIKWWMVPFVSSREENSLPAELCSLPASRTSQDGAWFATGNISGHQNLRWLHLFIDYMIVFMHQAQYPIERRLHVYAGQANSDPGLDLSLLGH